MNSPISVETESLAKRIVEANDGQLIAWLDQSARALSLPGPSALRAILTVTGKLQLLSFNPLLKNGLPTATKITMGR